MLWFGVLFAINGNIGGLVGFAGNGIDYQKTNAAQQSVHLTPRILRHPKQFPTLKPYPTRTAEPSPLGAVNANRWAAMLHMTRLGWMWDAPRKVRLESEIPDELILSKKKGGQT